MKRLLPVCLILLCALLSCGKEDVEIIKNKTFVPINLTKAQEDIALNVNSLGFDVLSSILTDEPLGVQGMIVSPLSLSSALSMCANGAAGATQEQMLGLLGTQSGSVEDLNVFYSFMLDALVKADAKVDFVSANSIWYDETIALKENYIKGMADVFDAKIEDVDFSDISSVEKINEWCFSKTCGQIPRIIDEVDPSVSVKLLNALYFNGLWATPFEDLKERSFTHADGSTSMLKSVVASKPLRCVETDMFKCVEIPYGNGAYVMNMILPSNEASVLDVSESLADGGWDKAVRSLHQQAVQLEFPLFEVKYSIELSRILNSLGMCDAFLPSVADFSNMSDNSLFVSSVSQHAIIKVTEKGSEVSSVTDVTMGETSAGPNDGVDEIFEFIANRPFLYLIRESSTGVILFLGVKS